MDFNTKFTPHTWPDHPEQATMEGKIKSLVSGFSLPVKLYFSQVYSLLI